MYAHKTFPDTQFVKIAKGVAGNMNLSAQAVRLYVFMMGLPASLDFSNGYLMKGLGVKKSALAVAKSELITEGLLYIHREGPRSFRAYISIPGRPAEVEFNRMRLSKSIEAGNTERPKTYGLNLPKKNPIDTSGFSGD